MLEGGLYFTIVDNILASTATTSMYQALQLKCINLAIHADVLHYGDLNNGAVKSSFREQCTELISVSCRCKINIIEDERYKTSSNFKQSAT
jgi:hypothetical protein